MDAAFNVGDRVAWHHEYATQHAAGSIIRADAVPAAGLLGVGEIVGANDTGTEFDVLLDGAKKPRTLTADELVRIAEQA